MPKLINDFSALSDRNRQAIALIYLNKGNIVAGMREAGYKNAADEQLKVNYKRIMKKKESQEYLEYIKKNPEFLEQELEWFKRDPSIRKDITEININVPTQLTEQHKTFLESYFINGDRFRSMCIAFPEANYSISTKTSALRKASNILKNKSSIEYMNLLNDGALQELFLSKSKIIKEVYELAKDCKDSKSRFAAVKAYELLGRMTGLLNDQKTVNINDGGQIQINYVVPDKIDYTLQEDIQSFLKDGVKDVEYQQYEHDDEKPRTTKEHIDKFNSDLKDFLSNRESDNII